jgi:hypothetical protein
LIFLIFNVTMGSLTGKILFIIVFTVLISSCNRGSYPCPAYTEPAKISANGDPFKRRTKQKVDKNGRIKKKNPAVIRRS